MPIIQWRTDILASVELTAAGVIDVAGISQAYRHLELFLQLESDSVVTADFVYIIFNDDSTPANYHSSMSAAYDGGSAQDTTVVQPRLTYIPGASATDKRSSLRVFIPFYSDTDNYKSCLYEGMVRRGATSMITTFGKTTWMNINAITRITLEPDGYPGDELVSGSRLTMLGYKNK